ncbi:MAG TPA: tetratricopeptide repeat protein, partial [Candidatus Nanopelagicales bacterium]|nr:tetratricopeptide repeat protein [Candidatus Nanopelagicales bacterium]
MFLIPLLVALGCSSAFAEALQRGDLLAQKGRWDHAAAEYERALALEPGNEEARQKLWMARRSQSSERVERARVLLQQGDAPGAMMLAEEAARLDPSSVPARQILGEAIARTLDGAEQLLAAGDARRALELTTLVIRVAP